jgi:predicted DNA-binding transcriptional regulator AlpA
MISNEPIFKISQAAKRLGFERQAIHQMFDRGEFPNGFIVEVMGRKHRRIPESDLLAVMKPAPQRSSKVKE